MVLFTAAVGSGNFFAFSMVVEGCVPCRSGTQTHILCRLYDPYGFDASVPLVPSCC